MVKFMKKETSINLGLYLIKPEVKPGLACPVPKDAKPAESAKAYHARKYMAMHASRSDAEEKGESE